MRVFLSYRREDSAPHAGRLADTLRARLGHDRVFIDVAAIRAGSDFEQAIDDALARTDAVLVVIGPRWLEPAPGSSPASPPRLAEPGDYVRREVAAALAAAVRVVPVLVGGVVLPPAEELPDDVAPLVRRQAVSLDDATWHRDVEHLLDSLEGRPPTADRRARVRPPVVVALAAVLVALGVAAVLALRPGGGGGGDDDPPELPSCPDADETWMRLLGPDADASVTVEDVDGSVTYQVTDVVAKPVNGGGWEVVLTSVMTNDRSDLQYHEAYFYDQLEVDRIPSEKRTCFSGEVRTLAPGQRSRARVGFAVDDDPTRGIRLVVGDDPYGDFTLTTPTG